MRFSVLALFLLSACASTQKLSFEKQPLPSAPIVVPSSLDVIPALERVESMLAARGFTEKRAVRAFNEQMPERALSRASGALEPKDAAGGCSGSVEVIQASARPVKEGGSELRLSCYTERLERKEGCEALIESGCPSAGDQVVGRIAFDAVGL